MAGGSGPMSVDVGSGLPILVGGVCVSLSINPDLGDSIVIESSGVKQTISYSFRDDSVDENGDYLFANGEKSTFEAQFPRDFGELSTQDGELEEALMLLARMVARRAGIHS